MHRLFNDISSNEQIYHLKNLNLNQNYYDLLLKYQLKNKQVEIESLVDIYAHYPEATSIPIQTLSDIVDLLVQSRQSQVTIPLKLLEYLHHLSQSQILE